jgi:hypothetical protein
VKRIVLMLLLFAPVAWAQETVETDPIRCWLKTDRAAVHIGEQFTVSLTCAVVDTGHVTVEPDLARIEPEAIQLAPFEVVRGTHHPDIRSGVQRYFQYEYTVRLVEDGFFGQEVEIPAVTVQYTVHTTAGTADQQGIARSYPLPALAMRIHSLVPQNARDIRDAPSGSFAQIDARKFRSTAAMTSAAILFAFAALFFLLGVARALSRLRKRARNKQPTVSIWAALQASLGTLQGVASEVESGGWSAAKVAEALAAVRVGASVASGRAFAQAPATDGANDHEGEILLHKGLVRRRRFVISGSVTPSDAVGSDDLREALLAFSEARYSRDAALDRGVLDGALERSREALRHLRIRKLLPWIR